MYKEGKKITVEWTKDMTEIKSSEQFGMTSPIKSSHSGDDKLTEMIKNIMSNEFPMIKENSMFYNLIVYITKQKFMTVQSFENVLSYIKRNNAKTVQDVSFKQGEVFIKCSI